MSWIEDAVFYNIYPLGFCGAGKNNDSEVVYRLDKIYDWLPHMKELGVTALIFNPVFESTSHGYDTKDYYTIDCRLGDNESFKNICRSLKENGIKVLLDGVFNHVGRDFWAFADVRRNLQNSPYCSWFQNLNFGGDSPYGDHFSYEGWAGNYDLVKLNLQNQSVVDHLLGAVQLWIEEFDIDGLRLDAADCIDDKFFRQLRVFCKSKKSEFWLYGEIIHGDYNRWANPEMLDSVTNYECYKGLYSSHNDHNYFEIAHSLERQFGKNGIYKDLYTYNFVDNHDVNRIGSVVKDKNLLCNIHTLLYTMPGAPSIYYGSEWAIEGVRTRESDSALRPCLDIDNIPNPDYVLCDHLKKLGSIRHELSALKNGSFENVVIKNEQLVIKRKNSRQIVYCVLNLSSAEQLIEFPVDGCGVLTDVLNGNIVFNCSNYVKIPVPPYGSRILVLSNDKEEESVEAAPLRIGKYRHFKGKEYEIVDFARHSETLENMVVYRALYGEFGLWVRPYDMFVETVEHEGRKVLRFAPID